MTAASIWRQSVARVRRQIPYGAEHYWLDVDVDDPFRVPEPGQFVQILLGATHAATLLPRPMSVAAATRTRRGLTLGFLYAPVGVGTRALASLPPGARVELLGPLGRGFPLDRPGTIVLVAGGRGVAPLLFAASSLARRRRRVEFLFGARDREHLVGLPQAEALLRRVRGTLRVCTDDGSRGRKADVVTLLDRVSHDLEPPIVVHACGPHGMLKAVAAWSMRRESEAWLAMESIMACGTGVCRGCPLPRSRESQLAFRSDAPSLLGNREFAMCCTEGPVFESRQLDWDRID